MGDFTARPPLDGLPHPMPAAGVHSFHEPGGQVISGQVISGRPRTAEHARAEKNARLVPAVLARRFPSLRADPDRWAEAYGAGYLGLVTAAERFDPAQGGAFSTFAVAWIRGAVLMYLRDERRRGQLPCVSLAAPVHGSSGEAGAATLADSLADDAGGRPGAVLLAGAGFEARVEGLPERQRELLRAVYRDERTLTEIAATWGVSRARVGQVHAQALKALRERL